MNVTRHWQPRLGAALLGCALGATAAPAGAHTNRPWLHDWAPMLHNVSRYRDVRVARHDGYVKGTECVSGGDGGAMGIHYVRPDLLGDGTVDLAHPEALVYAPRAFGGLRLVAAEYITFSDAWHGRQGEQVTPSLAGQAFHFINAPNRYHLPALYELHVWAFKHNPKGMFANFNPEVSCLPGAPST